MMARLILKFAVPLALRQAFLFSRRARWAPSSIPFIVTLYNAAGPGQAISAEQLAAIEGLTGTKKLQVVISLSCTMCPELVMAAGRLAVENSGIEVDVFDINLFPGLREQHAIMSVPCIIYDGRVSFGKKNIDELLKPD